MTKGTIKDVRLWLARLAGRTFPTSQVGEFVDRLIHDKMHYRGPERRRCPRYPLAVSVSAIPLDNQLQPAGSPFDALTRDTIRFRFEHDFGYALRSEIPFPAACE